MDLILMMLQYVMVSLREKDLQFKYLNISVLNKISIKLKS